MPYLVDTNVLLRVRHRTAPEYPLIRSTLRTLFSRSEPLYFTSQNLVEFWNVSTRPATARGGFGLSVVETHRRARLIERLFTLLPDTPDIHAEWRRLVVNHSVSGVQVHDARLAAAMNVYGLSNLLTLNTADFARFPGITAVHPQDIR